MAVKLCHNFLHVKSMCKSLFKYGSTNVQKKDGCNLYLCSNACLFMERKVIFKKF